MGVTHQLHIPAALQKGGGGPISLSRGYLVKIGSFLDNFKMKKIKLVSAGNLSLVQYV